MKIKNLTCLILALGLALAASPGCVDKKPGRPSVARVSLTALEPTLVKSGQTASLVGSGFPEQIIDDMAVLVAGVKAEILSTSFSRIRIRLPELRDGVAQVVLRLNGKVYQGLSFTYLSEEQACDIPALLSACPLFKELNTVSSVSLSSCVYEAEFTATLSDSSPLVFYVLSAQTPSARLKVALPGNTAPVLTLNAGIPAGWSRATLSSMAAAMDGKDGNVLAMVNGDFWNTTRIIPKGPVHFRGEVVSDFWDNTEDKPQQGVNYFCVSSTGSPLIDSRASYSSLSAVPELTGAGTTLVWSGQAEAFSNSSIHPRCAVGYTTEGRVFFVVADGRGESSPGLTYEGLSMIFVSLGCDRAANLDGGGSAQILLRDPLSGKFSIRNKPADGKERPVINAWAIVQ